jgi:hypothetical protein
MSELKSGIILKGSVFIPDYDNYNQMLKELNIKDTQKNAETLFVKVQLIPKNNNIFSDVNTWTFIINQDIIPEWFVAENEEKRMKEAVKKWYNKHVFIKINDLELSNGVYYLKDCKNANITNGICMIYGDSSSKHFGNCFSKHYNDCKSEHHDNSNSIHHDNCFSVHYDDTKSIHYGNSSSEHFNESVGTHFNNNISKHFNDSLGIMLNHYSSKKENIILYDNSTLKDCVNKIVYQNSNKQYDDSNWKLILVDNRI